MENSDPGAGAWTAAATGAIAAIGIVVYGVVRLVRHVNSQIRADRDDADVHKGTIADRHESRESRRKREAADEAWKVVDAQQKLILSFEEKVKAVEDKCDQAILQCQEERDECNRERSYLLGRLEVIELWAQTKGFKLPPSIQKSGSGVHRRLSSDQQQETGNG